MNNENTSTTTNMTPAQTEISDLIKKAIELANQQGEVMKSVVEHLNMAMQAVEGGNESDGEQDDFGEMMKSKGQGAADMIMSKSASEATSSE